MALMTFRHGLRVSELTDMRLEQVDVESMRFSTRRLKHGHDTTHPIEGDELRAIRAWLRERSTHKLAHSPLLFLSNRGPMTRQAVNYLFKVIGRKAGIEKKVNPHALRHACGYALANNNTATRTIQDYLGHRNIRHTETYTASNPERFKNIWRK
jgi:site-specific recombinase XerD